MVKTACALVIMGVTVAWVAAKPDPAPSATAIVKPPHIATRPVIFAVEPPTILSEAPIEPAAAIQPVNDEESDPTPIATGPSRGLTAREWACLYQSTE
jgi:hypothetical protein